MTQYKFCLTDADARGRSGWLNADKGGSKIGKILRTSFMDDPLVIFLARVHLCESISQEQWCSKDPKSNHT